MAVIQTGNTLPGILELLYYKSESGRALSNLAHTILHGRSDIPKGDRELIAAFVSYRNGCEFCHDSHSASEACHNGKDFRDRDFTEYVKERRREEKIDVLLEIAEATRKDVAPLRQDLVARARQAGLSDAAIHDAVLIAAAFCMYNRYVDTLGTRRAEAAEYSEMGVRLSQKGYKYPPWFLVSFVKKLLTGRFGKAA